MYFKEISDINDLWKKKEYYLVFSYKKQKNYLAYFFP